MSIWCGISAIVVGGSVGLLFVYVMDRLNEHLREKWQREMDECN